MKINKRRIQDTNAFFLWILGFLLVVGLFTTIIYLINNVSLWFALLLLPLMWITVYFLIPNEGDI